MNAILQVENLTKQYADFKLDHVSFSVPKGTIMGLIGENGAGKSTTINAILDLIHKDDGTVTFWGQELSSTKQIKEDVGVVFDGINFYETLTPAKVGKIAGAAYKQWDGHLFQDYLKRFQLPADKEIKSLSKGMKMKLCIAVALSHNPKLLILDEATSGLDPVMRDDILDVFLEFVQDENHSILMSSHITTDLEKVADYITFIHQGKVLFCKTKDELRYNYGIIRCGAALFDQLDKAEILAYRKDDYQWNVLVADKEKARRKYKNAVVDDATIDDILLLYLPYFWKYVNSSCVQVWRRKRPCSAISIIPHSGRDLLWNISASYYAGSCIDRPDCIYSSLLLTASGVGMVLCDVSNQLSHFCKARALISIGRYLYGKQKI